jgi:hypothetical protein
MQVWEELHKTHPGFATQAAVPTNEEQLEQGKFRVVTVQVLLAWHQVQPE